MKLLQGTKKKSLAVIITGFIILSCLYWIFFSFSFSILLNYILLSVFYVTCYRLRLKTFEKKEHLLFDYIEQSALINTIFLFFVLILKTLTDTNGYKSIIWIYTSILIILFLYYIYKLKKQRKSPLPTQKISSTTKATNILICIFLLFDFFVYNSGKLSIQLVLYMPFLFLILTVLLFIYKKVFAFRSFFALILFCNIYMCSTGFIVLNYALNNSFALTILFHFMLFTAASFMIHANSELSKDDDFIYAKEFIFLLFINIILIFISLTNIFAFVIPQIFISYTFFIAILFIAYILYYNYKIYINQNF